MFEIVFSHDAKNVQAFLEIKIIKVNILSN